MATVDPLEAMSRRAVGPVSTVARAEDQAAAAARAQLAAERKGFRASRPYVPAGGCPDCAAAGASASEAAQIHSGMSRARSSYDYDAEVTRLMDAGFSLAAARAGAAPVSYR